MVFATHSRVRIAFTFGLFLLLLQAGSLGCKKKDPAPTPPDATDPLGKQAPSGKSGSARTFRVPGQDFEIDLLGDGWKVDTAKAAPKIANYYRLRPTMLVGVFPVSDADSEKAHEENSRRYKENLKKARPSTKILSEITGTNDHGQPFWMVLVEERHDTRAFLAGGSITWLHRQKTVSVLFEGHYSSTQEADIERERQTLRDAAERALRSVR